MRILWLPFCFLFTHISISQTTNGIGFNSVFQDVESGLKNGHVNGLLKVKKVDSTDSLKFIYQDAKLQILPDFDNVYDVSEKQYSFSVDEIQVQYSTYGLANSFSLNIDGEEYINSTIDGACDLILDGLLFKYTLTTGSEHLVILFKSDLLLKNSDNGNSISILQNSFIAFAIPVTN